jgi:hypothetical protein
MTLRESARTVLSGFSDAALIEGTPETRRDASLDRLGRNKTAAARRHPGWREFNLNDLTVRDGGFGAVYYETIDGELLERSRGNVFSISLRDDLQSAVYINEGETVGFTVTDEGDVIPLQPAPLTITKLNLREARRRHRDTQRRIEKREDAMALREFRASQPTQPLTLADVEGTALPTVQNAASTLLGLGAKLTVRNGRLEIALPERLAPAGREQEHQALRASALTAARVLLAAGDVVVGAVDSSSTKTLVERLPAVQVLAAGGIA